MEGFEPVKAGWELDEVDGFDLDAGLGCERLGFLVCLAGRGLDLEWGLGLLVKVQVACLGEELIPLHLHDLVDICGVECFLLSIGVKRLRAVYGAVEQEACIEGLQELQDVMPNLGRPLVRCDVWGLCRLYDGHEAGLFSSSSAAGVGSVAHNLRRGLGVTTRGS